MMAEWSSSSKSQAAGTDVVPAACDTGHGRAVLLENLFAASEVPPDDPEFLPTLEQDVAEECTRCTAGKVLVVRAQMPSEGGVGSVRLVFDTRETAGVCISKMNGRCFDGRKLSARLAAAEPSDPDVTVLPVAGIETQSDGANTQPNKTAASAPAEPADDLLQSFLSSV